MKSYWVTRHETPEGELLAISLVRSTVVNAKPGVDFLTANNLSQQLAIIHQPSGHEIPRHAHLLFPREVTYTQETLLVVEGFVRVDLYDRERMPGGSVTLGAGDIILLVSGGHGFVVLEECLMVEVKQGPFDPQRDKERF